MPHLRDPPPQTSILFLTGLAPKSLFFQTCYCKAGSSAPERQQPCLLTRRPGPRDWPTAASRRHLQNEGLAQTRGCFLERSNVYFLDPLNSPQWDVHFALIFPEGLVSSAVFGCPKTAELREVSAQTPGPSRLAEAELGLLKEGAKPFATHLGADALIQLRYRHLAAVQLLRATLGQELLRVFYMN